MDPPTPIQQLAPFRSFCAEGRDVQTLCEPDVTPSAQDWLKQDRCQKLYTALCRVLIQLEASTIPDDARQTQKTLPPDLLDLLTSLVANDTEKHGAKPRKIGPFVSTAAEKISGKWPSPILES
jgi:hypothetical protein